MECAGTAKKDEEGEEANMSEHVETIVQTPEEIEKNISQETSNDGQKNIPKSIQAVDVSRVGTLGSQQTVRSPLNEGHSKPNSNSAMLSQQLQNTEKQADSFQSSNENTSNTGKGPSETLTEQETKECAQSIIPSDLSGTKETEMTSAIATEAQDSISPREKLTCEAKDEPSLILKKELNTEDKQMHSEKKEAREEHPDLTENFNKSQEELQQVPLSSEILKLSPENTNMTVQPMPLRQESCVISHQERVDPHQNFKSPTVDEFEGKEKTQVKQEQEIVTKNTEHGAKKKQIHIGSGTISKRRASETPVFKYAQPGKDVNKNEAKLSPGKAIITSPTGIKSSRSAEELQQAGIGSTGKDSIVAKKNSGPDSKDFNKANKKSSQSSKDSSHSSKDSSQVRKDASHSSKDSGQGSKISDQESRDSGQVSKISAQASKDSNQARKYASQASKDLSHSSKDYGQASKISGHVNMDASQTSKASSQTSKDSIQANSEISGTSRNKSETPMRSRLGDNTKRGDDLVQCISPSNDNQQNHNQQDHTLKSTNNDTSGKIEMGQKPLKLMSGDNPTTEENKIPENNDKYSDTKEIKTQQNMKVASAEMALVNKTVNDKRTTESKLSAKAQSSGGEKGRDVTQIHNTSSDKSKVLNEAIKQTEVSFAQKQIDEMFLDKQTLVSDPDISHSQTSSEADSTKIPSKPIITEKQHLPTVPQAKGLTLNHSNDSKDIEKQLQKVTKECSEVKLSNKMESFKCPSKDDISSSKVQDTQVHIHDKDNKISSPTIQAKTEHAKINKLTGISLVGKQETTNSTLTKCMPSKSLLQDNKNSQIVVKGQGDTVENRGQEAYKSTISKQENIRQKEVNMAIKDKRKKEIKQEDTHKQNQIIKTNTGKENYEGARNKTISHHSVDGSTPSTQTQTDTVAISEEVVRVDMPDKPVLHTHEELDKFISNQIQVELISNWVMNGEELSPTSPHDINSSVTSDLSGNLEIDITSRPVTHKTFEGELVEPRVVQDHLQRSSQDSKVSMNSKVGGVVQTHGAKLGTSKVVTIVQSLAERAGGQGRLAPIQDEEENKEHVMDQQAQVQLDGLDEDVGRGCGGMKSTSCRLYFGVKNYLNQFYDPNSTDNTPAQTYYYTEDDDSEYLVDPDKEPRRQRCCRGFWFRAGVWGGVNLLLVGVIALMVGYLTPPRDMVVGYHDNLEILDRWAMAFNHRLELCRLAGFTVFCCGGVVLLVTLVLSSFVPGPRRCHQQWHPNTTGLPTAAKIPVTEQIKSVQPSPWPDLSLVKQQDLSVPLP